jgi:hypothetical protein
MSDCSPKISLFPRQVDAKNRLLELLCEQRAAVDASDMGTGKTLVAANVAKELGRPFAVVCPKVSIPVWKKWCQVFDVHPLFVLNYEKLRAGNTPWGTWVGRGRSKQFQWNLPATDTLLIFDEAHRGKAPDSQNAMMLRDAAPFVVLLLSASLAKDPTEMRAVSHLLRLARWEQFYRWARANGCRKGRFGGLEMVPHTRETTLQKLHEKIFKERGVRNRRDDDPDFPETLIEAEAFEFGCAEEIQKAYDEMEAELAEIEERASTDQTGNALTVRLRARQKTELLKVPGIVSLTEDALEAGHSVIIFTNFRPTLEALCHKLGTTCAVYGGQMSTWREEAIRNFQAGQERVIILNIQAGGESISLHDEKGDRPRLVLLCPTDSAIALTQATGRAWRKGGKSKSIQKILFAAGTVEERVCRNVQAKIKNIESLNDGDLALSNHFKTPNTMPTETTKTNQHNERTHSKHSPSSLVTKALCEGFANDPSRDTSLADRGTLGHEAVEQENIELIPPEDSALREAAEKCIQWTRANLPDGWVVHREIKVKILDQSGHIDRVALSPDQTQAQMVDYKFAHNEYKADSPQFWAYCLGLWELFPTLESVQVYVLHPFLDVIDFEEFTYPKHYDLFFGRVAAIISRAENPDSDNFRIGKHCNWCLRAADGTCAKLASVCAEIAAKYDPDNAAKYALPQGPVRGEEIDSPEAFSVLLRIKPIVEKAAAGWSSGAKRLRIEEGFDIPGWDLAERKGAREITNAKLAYEAVKDRIPAEVLLEAADLKIGALETLWKETFGRGDKKKSLADLMDRLTDADAISNGAPTTYFRELKQKGSSE